MATLSLNRKKSERKKLKRKRKIIDTLYVKLLRDPSTNVIIGIVSIVFIIWMVIPLLLILSGAVYIPSAAETFAFRGEITTVHQTGPYHTFDINATEGIGKIVIFLQTPKGSDFDLSVIDHQDRRTGGNLNTEVKENSIPNAKYYPSNTKNERVVIKSPDLPETGIVTWDIVVYSNKGTGEYLINVAIYLEESGQITFYAFGRVFSDEKFFNFKGDSSTSFFTKNQNYEFGGYAKSILYSNGYIYTAEGFEGIEVLNVTDYNNVEEINQIKFDNSFVTDIEQRGELLFASDSRQGLMIFNVSDVGEGTDIVSITPLPTNKTEFITIHDNYAFLDYQDDGFLIYDISDPSAPELIGNATLETDSDDIKIKDNYAYLVGSYSRLMIFDISDPSNPSLYSRVEEIDGISLRAKEIQIIDDYAYLSLGSTGFVVLDISDPSNITLVHKENRRADNINVFNNKAFITSKIGDFYSIEAYDVTNPYNISHLLSYSLGIVGVEDIFYDPITDFVYVANGGDGVLILDTHDMTEFEKIYQYQDNIEITTYKLVGVSRGIVLNTLILGLVTTLISVLLGTSLAFILARYEFPGKKFFSVLALAPLIIPPFISGMGFRYFLGPNGLLNTLFLIPVFHSRFIIEGFVAICFVQSFHFYALVYLNAFSSFVNVDPSMEEQAENLGAGSFRLFFTVTLPLALPGIGAGAILVLILSMEDVGTPIIFVGMGDNFARQFLTYYIFSDFQLSSSNIITPEVCVLGGLLLVIAIAGFLVIRKYVSLRQYSMVSKGRAGQYRLSKAKWKLLIIYPFLVILFALSLIVHVGIIMMSISETLGSSNIKNMSFTLENYRLIFVSSQYNIPSFVRNTLLYSFAATILIVILGSLAAYVVSRKEFKGKAAFDSLVTVPIAIPGIVLALGYYRTFDWGTIFTNNPNSFNLFMNKLVVKAHLDPFVGIAYVLLVLSYTIRKFPFTVRAAYAGLQQMDKVLEESSFNLGAGRMKTFAKITVPMISLNVFAGSLVSFLYCLSEVSTTVFLITSELGGTLTWMMANQVNARFQIFCALGVILMFLQILSLVFTNIILGSRTEAITGV
ncbi:MAG: ABC transporter permease subunit [Candidatus Heimdallarchaeaceae archaeon]